MVEFPFAVFQLVRVETREYQKLIRKMHKFNDAMLHAPLRLHVQGNGKHQQNMRT